MSSLTTSRQGLGREELDPSEDSGLSTTSGCSDSDMIDATMKNDENIGKGIEFVDPQCIQEDLIARRKKEKEIKISEAKIQKRLDQEAYEKEIQEKQYKRLMHLLNQSKALSSFILTKFQAEEKKLQNSKSKRHQENRKDDKSPPSKRLKKTKSKNTSTKSGKRNIQKKLNLSEEDIKEELASMSDEETNVEKENINPSDSFIQPKYFNGNLRDYQVIGFNWLKVLFENDLNGILADEMGLGKTVQVIALLAYLIEKRIPGPYMIVVPLSTLPNWESEFERFAPQLPVVVYYGNTEERRILGRQIMKEKHISNNFSTHPIVLMTYQAPLSDHYFLSKFTWRYIIIDEAQRIKNFDSQLTRILRSMKSMNRLLLTGTPLQNNLTELWALLNFLLPDIFNNLEVFQSWFDAKEVQDEKGKSKFFKQEEEKQILATLREILKPFMLRRVKEDVCPDIPPMKEVLVYTPLTAIQYDLYSAILRRDLNKLFMCKKEESLIVDVDGVRPKRKCTRKVDVDTYYYPDLNKSKTKHDKKQDDMSEWKKFTAVTEQNADYLIRLRLCNEVAMYRHVVNHPYIIHYPITGIVDNTTAQDDIIKVSGKLLVLDAMLKKLKQNGHKILLFSTMTMVLDIIEDYLCLRDYLYVRLDGTTKYENRKDSIDAFQKDPHVFLFLLSTKAGAVGLNLAAADTVIIYDSDWNPQNDLQAMARCHRIGQTKPVVVYRLCTKGTIDEEIIKRANAKRFLEKAVISADNSVVSSKDGLSKLQKSLEENSFKVDSKTQVYTEAELDELLDRSDMTIKKDTKDEGIESES